MTCVHGHECLWFGLHFCEINFVKFTSIAIWKKVFALGANAFIGFILLIVKNVFVFMAVDGWPLNNIRGQPDLKPHILFSLPIETFKKLNITNNIGNI